MRADSLKPKYSFQRNQHRLKTTNHLEHENAQALKKKKSDLSLGTKYQYHCHATQTPT
ncbi:MAG: hypothetical protein RLZZ24_30, partial [Pseudomonadota bacterium]